MSAQIAEHPPRARNRLVVVADSDYLQWLSRLATATREPIPVIVDKAIHEYALKHQFEPAPERLAGR